MLKFITGKFDKNKTQFVGKNKIKKEDIMKFEQWNGFKEGSWEKEVNVRNFIQKNYTPYEGDSSFLSNATEKTKQLWAEVLDLYKKEREAGGVLAISNDIASTISSHDAGYINKELEEIVGLQTEEPLKRAIMPNGGIRIMCSL